jgi:hypothetical protein
VKVRDSGDQSLDLFTQLLFVFAHFRHMGCLRLSLKLQGLVEPGLQFFPLLRHHRFTQMASN